MQSAWLPIGGIPRARLRGTPGAHPESLRSLWRVPLALTWSHVSFLRGRTARRARRWRLRRGEVPWRTQLRKTPTTSRSPEVFHEEAVLDGAAVELLRETEDFALVRTAGAGAEGWVQKQYLYQLAEVPQMNASDLEDADVLGPLVLTDATPTLSGWQGRPLARMQPLAEVVASVQWRCRLATEELGGATRAAPRFLRYSLQSPATPIVIGAYQARGAAAFRAVSPRLLSSMDVQGYLSVPQPSSDLLQDLVPPQLRPPERFCFALLGPGADSLLRRDVVIYGQCLLLLSGHLDVRLLPPGAEGLGAFQGQLGCAVSPLDLFAAEAQAREMYEAHLQEGDALLVPPGWWHQAKAGLDGAALAISPLLTPQLARSAEEEMRRLDVEDQMSPIGSSEQQPGDQKTGAKQGVYGDFEEFGRTLATLASMGHQVGVGAWPFLPHGEAPSGSCEACLRRLLEEYPGFAYSGAVLPMCEGRDLQRFIATGGFIAPAPRPLRPFAAADRLRRWLDLPLSSGLPTALEGDAPRVVWMFWAQGSELTGFRRLCVHTWRLQNPSWQVVILDKDSVWRYFERGTCELPACYEETSGSPAIGRLALGAPSALRGGLHGRRHHLPAALGGEWVWRKICSGPLEQGLGAWYVEWFGVEPGGREYVENWFLAARAGHPLVLAWRDLYVAGWADARTRHEYPLGPLFRDVDLSHITIAEHRDWLLMHVCFKKLIDEDAELRRIWSEQMLLLKADTGALAWMADVDADRPEEMRCGAGC
ncbi:unnamed protein product [Effrenium voratum]|nr:unnamed protein product [Effrenium voratum]